MHDIDRALFEAEAESQFGESQFGESPFGETFGETFGESEGEFEGEFESGQFGEFGQQETGISQELALASELLEVSSETELDRFLGDLISGAVSAARGFAKSDAGKAVGGVLKSVAKKALPQVGQYIGNAIKPGVGGDLGQRAGQWLGNRLELETEGMSAEDREFEAARSFVRFAQETAQRAAQAPGSVPPGVAASRAASAAALHHLPGLVRTPSGATTGSPAMQGRWVRRGNRIVILGA